MSGRLARVAEGVLAKCPGNAPPGFLLGVQSPTGEQIIALGSRTVAESTGGLSGLDAMTRSTSHDLASVTKIVATTTALIRLASQGVIRLDAAVRDFLPTFGASSRSISVRDLLYHRSGLWEWQPLYVFGSEKARAWDFIDRLPVRYQPGHETHYSDLGFMLLGRIIEVVTAERFDRAIAELVLRPLGLSETTFRHPVGSDISTGALDDRAERAMLDNQAPYPVGPASSSFARWPTSKIHGDVFDGNAFHVFDGVSGDAGLFSTAPDLLRFVKTLASFEDHAELWKPDVAAHFFNAGPNASQGLGFRRYTFTDRDRPVTVVGHSGYVGVAVGFIPGTGRGFVMASNRLLVTSTPASTESLWMDSLLGLAAAGLVMPR